MKITTQQFIQDSKELAKKIPKGKYKYVWGIPKGGILLAYIISQELGIEMIDQDTPTDESKTLIVDDLLDSGKTFSEFEGFDTAVLYNKNETIESTYFLKKTPNEWIELPHEKVNDIEDNIVRIFQYIGENPSREGLKDTPKRIVKMWREIFKGYNPLFKPTITTFENGKDGIFYDQIIIDKGYYFSHCEHHGVSFFGDYYFGYVPDKKILGLSKVARIVDYFSSKLQIQERLVKEIVDELEKELQPKGIAFVMKGRHLCKEMRGIKMINGEMITSDMRGVFRNEPETRAEFMDFINK